MLPAIALAIVVGKIVSAGLLEPRSHSEFPSASAESTVPVDDAVIIQPVESGACTSHGEDADDEQPAALNAPAN